MMGEEGEGGNEGGGRGGRKKEDEKITDTTRHQSKGGEACGLCT